MTLLKQVAADVGRIALAILGSAFALVFTAGVGDGIAEARDPFEALIGLVFGAVVVGVAAGVTSLVTLPALRHLGYCGTESLLVEVPTEQLRAEHRGAQRSLAEVSDALRRRMRWVTAGLLGALVSAALVSAALLVALAVS